MSPSDLGAVGERLAAEHLESEGYRILARNYRLGHREIDLIIGRGNLVAFVEVKARAGDGFGHPLESITARKRREIERVARSWQQRYGRSHQVYRFDAVGIRFRSDRPPRVEHIPNAWRVGE